MSRAVHIRVEKGRRVVIPAALCQEYGLEPGSPVVLEPSESGIIVRSLNVVIREVQAFFAATAPPDVSLSDELIRDRRAEARLEGPRKEKGRR